MEDLQTDTLSDYGKNQNPESTNKDNENTCAGTLLNGCEEIDDPLDLMDNCDNASIGSNSDVWRGSDSEDDCFDNKDSSQENVEPSELTKLTDEMDQTQPDGDNTIEPELKDDEEKEAADITQDNGDTANQTLESGQPDEEKSLIECEEQNATQEADVTDNQAEESKNSTNNEPEQDTLNGSNEDKETDNAENKTNPTKETEINTAEEKDTQIDNNEQNSSTVVDSQEGTVENINTENKENSSTENVETTKQKDDTSNKDANVEKDPLTSEDAGKNSLNSESAEKDPLNFNSAEPEPLVGGEGASPSRRPDRHNDAEDDDDSQIDYNDDDDFDPSLLCPEVSMAVDESPVITNSGPVPNDGNSSPLPYEPLFSTYVDDVTGAEISFNLSPEELELRKRLYGPTNPVQITKIHCTACNVHLGSALEGQNNRFVHPLLKVLICKECYHFYTSGEFEKDEDGSELYCRWCGQGGQVLCCSKCEFVFCKRCIRTNFGRKKMFEIRDSDSWDCFRCAPNQLITQRIACYEFFEYVRREISRASSLNDPEIWSKDHTRCCNKEKKKPLENGEEQVKKPRKRKTGDVDPDYNPLFNKPIILPGQQPSSIDSSKPPFTPPKGIVIPKPVQILPRSKPKDNDIEFVRHIPAPQVALNPINRPGTSGQFRKILPSNVRPAMEPPSLVRINSQPLPPLAPTSRLLNNALQGRPPTAHTMKHEWFEKTVRAAARVNSHLSYTLTQLNKAQSQAASVEELAVVHNKLQEILSSSINSLIQIRKNLRTEFIAGIKTVRLPSKKVESFANDDDVIFVSAPPAIPTPSTSQVRTTVADPIVIIDHSNKSSPTVNSTTPSTKTTETATVERPKGGYLKVKSVLELQNVPSECITIPDDTPTMTTPITHVNNQNDSSVTPPEIIVCNGVSNNETTATEMRSKTPDPLSITPEPPSKPTEEKSKEPDLKKRTPTPTQSSKSEPPVKKVKLDTSTSDATRDLRTRKSKERLKTTAYNIKQEPTPEIQKMLSVTVKLPKVDLEHLQKQLPNGCH